MGYDPSAHAVKCPYCGHENAIPQSAAEICELDFHAYLAESADAEDVAVSLTVSCSSCGAETTLDPNVTGDACPFCGAAIVTQHEEHSGIRPRNLLPFAVDRLSAQAAFQTWVRKLWFAPSKVKQYARAERSRLTGVYVPYWTYDAETTSYYDGERGDDYWVPESYTTTENGKTVQKTRQVRKTRWHTVSGVVFNSFDDILVLASDSLPRKYADRLEPWDLDSLTAYDESYLAGFRTERYHIGLEQGFEIAKETMGRQIQATVRADIGGDHQRIHSVRTQHDQVSFKHLLLPVWISAYRFGSKVYQFLVNARTGEVQGERPWSWVKIMFAALVSMAAVGAVIYVYSHAR